MRFGTACAVFLALLILPAGVRSQTTSATLSGTVTDPANKVVPAVDVTATNVDTGVASATKTNGDGIYLLPSLPPGHYRITVDKQGFRQIELTGVTLQVADTVTRNFHLELGAASQTITVEGNGLNVNTTDASVSTVIDREFVDEIPLNGRSLQNLLYLTPGVTVSGVGSGNNLAVDGNRDASSANWTVDGVSANLATSTAGSTNPDIFGIPVNAMSSTQGLISIDALQEFRVTTSTYSAEYGIAPGAQIQFQSRAGTNQFHGSAFDYLRNTIFDANNWFTNRSAIAQPAEHQNDFGGTFGGPVRIPHVYDGRNKAFFFFNYEELLLRQPSIVTDAPVPTAAYRLTAPAALQPFFNAMPLPNGALIGTTGWAYFNQGFSIPTKVTSVSGRGDYALTHSIRIFGRVSYSPSSLSGVADSYQTNNTFHTLTLTGGITMTPAASVTNELRLNYSTSGYTTAENPLPPTNGSNPSAALTALALPPQYVQGGGYYDQVRFSDPSFGGTASVLYQAQSTNLTQGFVSDQLHWRLGRHQLKAGMEWDRHDTVQNPIGYQTSYDFSTIAAINAATLSAGSTVFTRPSAIDIINTRAAAYVSDTWKVNSRLSIDYGLRWELPFPGYTGGKYPPLFVSSVANLADPTVCQSRTQWAMTWRNFAPRLGVAYVLRDAGNFETVLLTGGGLFYSTETGAAFGTLGFPNQSSVALPAGTPFPVAASLLTPPVAGVYTAATLSTQALVGFNPNLALPRVWQWNTSIEQKLGKNQSLTIGYVGSAGRRLFFEPLYIPTEPVFSDVEFTSNGSRSDYNSLQLKFDRHLARGLQMLSSYTWAHSIDNVSVDSFVYQPFRGNSDFDIRHNFSMALVYSIPGAKADSLVEAITSGWAFSSNFSAHTGLPSSVLVTANILPDGTYQDAAANIVPGVPLYVYGPQYPGGVALNKAAFTNPPAAQEGDSGRNQLRSQGFWQEDSSLQRKFSLGEKHGLLRLRVDAFNVFNHPNFSSYYTTNLANATFGQATQTVSQRSGLGQDANGGPRSLQFSLRYEF